MAAQVAKQIDKRRQTQSDLQTQRKEIERLRSTNEIYDTYKPDWDFYLGAYEGGRKFANADNLFRHPREHQRDFDARKDRLHYLNYCEPLVDFFTEFIFNEAIDREGGGDQAWFDEFVKDVNKKGEDIDTFMAQVCDDMQIFGMSFVLVDAPTIGGRMTLAQQQKLGIRPYFVIIKANEMFDWVVDPFDDLTYIKRQQIVFEYDGGSKTKRVIERYTEWTRQDIKITDVDITLGPSKGVIANTSTLENKLGEVPITVFRYKRSKDDKWMGVSFLRDIAMNNKEVMNLTSLLQEFLYRQAFNILSMQYDPNQEDNATGELGTSNVLMYPKDAERPQYVAPKVEAAEFIAKERAYIVSEMYKRAAQDMVNELYNGQKSSGFSKVQSFATTVPKIANRADSLEKGERKLWRLVYAYRRKEWSGRVTYRDRYEITNLVDSLNNLKTIFREMQVKSETFTKEQMKRMIRQADPKMPLDKLQKSMAEIDKMDINQWTAIQELALLGRAAVTPEAEGAIEAGTGIQPSDAPASSGPPASGSANPKEAAAMSGTKAQRPTSSSAELKSESTKTAKAGGRSAKR